MIKVANNLQNMLAVKAADQSMPPGIVDPGSVPPGTPPFTLGGIHPFADNQLANYATFGLGGGAAGAGIGALVNYLRNKSLLKGALTGGAIGAGAGIGLKGLADMAIPEASDMYRVMLRDNKRRQAGNYDIPDVESKWWLPEYFRNSENEFRHRLNSMGKEVNQKIVDQLSGLSLFDLFEHRNDK